MRKTVLLGVCAAAMSLSLAAQGQGRGPDLEVGARAKAAEQVVVGRVVNVSSRFDVNEFGDQLIVSDAELQVEETLKGDSVQNVTVTIEGGSIGDLTLDVSDMPEMARGDRAVLFIKTKKNGERIPAGRGHGVMKLDRSGIVEGTDVTLDEVKKKVRDAR